MQSPPLPGADSSTAQWDAERLNLALVAARLGDWSWDIATDVLQLSPRASEIFGLSPGDITWAELRMHLHADDREMARVAVERALREHTDYALEYRVVTGGRERWVAASGRGRYGEDGEVLAMYGVVQDITSDRLLVRLDDAVRPLVDPEEITSTVARMLGHHLGVNRCAYAFVEADQDTFILTGNYTNGVHSIVGRYRFRQFGAECLRLMRAGEPYVVDDSTVDPRIDEHDRAAYELTAIRGVICVPIHKAGTFVAAMAVHSSGARSWTRAEVALLQQVASRCWESIERARVEREREGLLAAAEAANRAKDEFLAMLGHELRNPLAPIVTALRLMELRNDTSSARERTVIERQVDHLTRLVDDLLDVSRIAEGKVELKLETVEMATIVASALEVASPLLEQRGHTVVVDVDRTGLAVEGDAARLTQVVSNLLTNAGKYTAPGGRITISAAAEDDQVVLRVADTGIGIAADVLPHVFDLFVQGRQTIDRASGGLGLGLAIVRSLVERHHGQVSAHSDGTGKGSELVISLPLARPSGVVVVAEAADTTAPGTSRARVLLVDDNEDAVEMLAAALGMLGCDVLVAYDGAQALDAVRERAFDIAFLDIGLPVMDGYELAGRLRALPALAATRLVAVTGYGQDADRRRALAAGFHQHLVKPVDLRVNERIVTELSAALVTASGSSRSSE